MADDLQTNLSTYKLQLQQVYFCRFSNNWKSGAQLVAKPHSIQGLNPGRFGLFWGWVVSALVVGSFQPIFWVSRFGPMSFQPKYMKTHQDKTAVTLLRNMNLGTA